MRVRRCRPRRSRLIGGFEGLWAHRWVDSRLEVHVFAVAERSTDLCLCLSALPLFLETNLVAVAAVDVLGLGPVTAVVEALVSG
jgi:hypothetical protein